MRSVFADTSYWVALASPQDQWNPIAKQVTLQLGSRRIITCDEVLAEFLNYFAERGQRLRTMAVSAVLGMQSSPNMEILPQTRVSFLAGLKLYQEREDKGYSLTDCISMHRLRDLGILEILTTDHHFEQEGFTILMKESPG